MSNGRSYGSINKAAQRPIDTRALLKESLNVAYEAENIGSL